MYIHGAASISPLGNLQHSVDGALPYLESLEPEYTEFVPARAMRRMGKAVKMGVYCGLKALAEAQIEMPDRIIVGTGLGCMSDTEKFLNNIVDDKENLLNPTPFIQSTHNTIAGQIALMLKCENYNFTYVHRGFSFESALLDAQLFLNENPEEKILVGGVDAITAHVHDVGFKLGFAKDGVYNPSEVETPSGPGSVLGEGAAFFTVSAKPVAGATEICGLEMVYKPQSGDIEMAAKKLLEGAGLTPQDIDGIVLGNSGDVDSDGYYNDVSEQFQHAAKLKYKSGVGDYHSATTMGMWVGHDWIQNANVHPDISGSQSISGAVANVLIYNHFRSNNHGLILLRRAQS